MSKHIFIGNTESSYIDVILKDGTYHHYTPRVLKVLLESHRVHKFKRSDSWVTVGVDLIRVRKPVGTSNPYRGSERRLMRH
ncbi:MAG: hypothetical protein GQ530_03860 [Desulfuromonadales bacterium]|nr:hypothetical protein [Desulfuromonadales bacterium]